MKTLYKLLSSLEKFAIGSIAVMIGVTVAPESLWTSCFFYAVGALLMSLPISKVPTIYKGPLAILFAIIAAIALCNNPGSWTAMLTVALVASGISIASSAVAFRLLMTDTALR